MEDDTKYQMSPKNQEFSVTAVKSDSGKGKYNQEKFSQEIKAVEIAINDITNIKKRTIWEQEQNSPQVTRTSVRKERYIDIQKTQNHQTRQESLTVKSPANSISATNSNHNSPSIKSSICSKNMKAKESVKKV